MDCREEFEESYESRHEILISITEDRTKNCELGTHSVNVVLEKSLEDMLTDKIHLPEDKEFTPEDILSSSLSVIFPDE